MNLSSAVIILVIISVGAMGFLLITNEMNIKYDSAISDPANSQGILLNNTSAYGAVKNTSDTIVSNLDVMIFMGMLFVIIFVMALVYSLSKRGG